MLATKRRFSSLSHLIQGPVRKQVPLVLRVEAPGKPSQELDLEVLSGGNVSRIGDFTVSYSPSNRKFSITVPSVAKVETAKYIGWKTIWDGSKTGTTATQMTLEIDSGFTIQVSIGKSRHMLGLMEQKPTSGERNLPALLANLKNMRWMVESGILHVLFLATLYVMNQIQIPWLQVPQDEKKEVVEIDVEMEPVRIADAGGEAGGFSGTQMPLPRNPEPAPKPKPAQSGSKNGKAASIAKGLSKIAQNLSSMDMGNLAANGLVKRNENGGANRLVEGMKNALGQVKQTSLGSSLKKVGEGHVGKGMKWDMFASKDQYVSSRDIDEVNAIFQRLSAEFRGCYETAMLKDAELSVVMAFEADIDVGGRLQPSYNLSGKSTDEGERVLTSCMTQVLRKVKLSKRLTGVKVKNEFIFKS